MKAVKFFVGFLILSLSFALCGCKNNNIDVNVDMIAHRGYSKYYADNTYTAFVQAGKRNFFGIETDVRLTKDNVYVCAHDDYPFNPLAVNPRILISESNWDDLKWRIVPNGKNFKLEHLCTLIDYLKICKKYEKISFMHIDIDLSEKQLEDLFSLAQAYYDLDKVVIVSDIVEVLQKTKNINSNIKIQYIALEDAYSRIAYENNYNITINYKFITEDIITQFHNKGLKVAIWTVDSYATVDKWQHEGVDYITSNYIEQTTE